MGFIILMWCGPGLNRRHKDFQSFALPTELPHHSAKGGRKYKDLPRLFRVYPPFFWNFWVSPLPSLQFYIPLTMTIFT